MKKLISSPAIQFKGSGWYVTDYGKGTKDTKPTKDPKGSKDQGSTEAKGTKESAASPADTKTTTSSEKKDS